MPDTSTLVMFALTALVLVAVPGPNLIYIITRSVSEGRPAGLVSAAGVETGTLVHVAVAAVGVSALLASSAAAFAIVKYAGAAYLVYLGLRALLRKQNAPSPQIDRAPHARIYRQALLVQLLNPKVAIFFLAFLPQFIDPARGQVALQIVVLGSLLTAVGLLSDVAYAIAASAAGAWLSARSGFERTQRRISGVVYIALGAAAARP